MKKFLVFFILIIFIYIFFNTDLIKEVSFDDDIIYLYVGEETAIDYSIKFANYAVTNYYLESETTDVIKINEGNIIGLNKGETNVKFIYDNEVYDKVKVVVSDLYVKESLDDKQNLTCNIYTEEENNLLDKILKYKIEKSGYKTRAGVVAAARFLTLSFPYKINYFYENGRLNNHSGDRNYVDGEGRYYHTGLYLNESKFDTIVSSYKNPSIWGCDLYSFITKTITPNGLDCSGFVTWALFNAGFDIGDVGAGDTEFTDDLSDLGQKKDLNNIDFHIKVGDLIGRDGHIGIIIGMENDNYYIAESLDTDLHVLINNKKELKKEWEYIIDMSNVYLDDGNITNIW